MIFLRIVHIGSGVIWVGNVVFFFFVIFPQIRRFTAARQAESLWAVKAGDRILMVAAPLTIASGIIIALRLKWGVLDTWFVSGWGYAMLVAFVATILYVVIGSIQSLPHVTRLNQVADEMGGQPPTLEQAERIRELYTAISYHWIPSLFLVIAVGAMAAARFL